MLVYPVWLLGLLFQDNELCLLNLFSSLIYANAKSQYILVVFLDQKVAMFKI